MTVNTTTTRSTGTGNGSTTVFPYTFAIQQASDLKVYVGSVLQTSGYTVSIDSDGVGGNVTFTTAPANGAALLFVRVVTLTQATSLPVEGNIPEDTLEDMSDKGMMVSQQLQEADDRTIKIGIANSGITTEIATPTANTVLGWDSAGTAIQNTTYQTILAGLTPVGLGTVVGPASSTDKYIAQWDGTTGRLLKGGIAPGAANTVLTGNGVSSDPTFQALPAIPKHICQGRLTLTTATPYVTNVTAATTLYFTPYGGNQIGLYDGSSAWSLLSFSELSIAVPAATNQMYDVFVYNNSGTAALELLAWTNDTTRATALTLQDGVLVKTGATTRRFVGCMRTTGVSGQTEVSSSKLFVSNYYNRLPFFMKAVDTTDSWVTTTATYHSANGNTTAGVGRVELIIPWAEILVAAHTRDVCLTDKTTYGNYMHSGIGLDSVTVNSSQLNEPGAPIANGTVGTARDFCGSSYRGVPAVGYHYLQHLVAAGAADNTTFYGDNGATLFQTGLLAELTA